MLDTNSSQPATPAHSRFQPFTVRDYQSQYYSEVIQDERLCLEFLVEALRRVPPVTRALDFACGPVVSHLVALASRAEELHGADFLASNRAEIERWAREGASATDWRPFTREILRLESGRDPSDADVETRERQTREQLKQVRACDITQEDPMGAASRHSYPLVTAHYCAEALGAGFEPWRGYMKNLLSLVAEGGAFVTTVCGSARPHKEGDFFRFHGERQALTMVTPSDLWGVLEEAGFGDLDLRVRELETAEDQGYDCLILAYGTARRSRRAK